MPEDKKHNIDIQLRSEDVQDILSTVPHWMIRWGNVLFLSIIILLLTVSWFVKYPDIIPSPVLVTTQIPPQKIYARVTGKLDRIIVTDNQVVTEEQALAIIENTANYKDVFLLKKYMDSISIRQSDYYFPFDQLPMLFLGEIENDFALFENAYMQYTLNKKLQPFTNDAIANKTSLNELKRRLQSLLSQKELQESELIFRRKDLARQKVLYEKGIIAAQDYENKQLAVLQAERNYKNSNLSISQIKEAISNAKKTSRGTEISKTREEILLQKNLIQTFNQLKKSIKNWELRYVLQSKMDGTVAFLNYWNKNQTVTQGDLVFTIIPTESKEFIAKLQAPALNSGKIKIGQTVNIKLQNYPEEEFGILKGKIINMSLVPNKDGLYLIDVSLPKKLITTYNKEIDFKQEMQGNAEIITEDLRLIERFFYQFRRILKR